MSSLASDREAALELIVEGYRRLEAHDENHDLLKYITLVGDKFELSEDEKIRDEFVDKYAPTDDIPVAVMLTRYYVDIKNAFEKIEGITYEPPEPVIIPTDETDEDVPF